MTTPKTNQYEEHLKRMIRRDHPELSEQEVNDVFIRIDTLSDILVDEWIALKNYQSRKSSSIDLN